MKKKKWGAHVELIFLCGLDGTLLGKGLHDFHSFVEFRLHCVCVSNLTHVRTVAIVVGHKRAFVSPPTRERPSVRSGPC
jgi:hypothetical protein